MPSTDPCTNRAPACLYRGLAPHLRVDVLDDRVDVDDIVFGEGLARAAVHGVLAKRQLNAELLAHDAQQRHLLYAILLYAAVDPIAEKHMVQSECVMHYKFCSFFFSCL